MRRLLCAVFCLAPGCGGPTRSGPAGDAGPDGAASDATPDAAFPDTAPDPGPAYPLCAAKMPSGAAHRGRTGSIRSWCRADPNPCSCSVSRRGTMAPFPETAPTEGFHEPPASSMGDGGGKRKEDMTRSAVLPSLLAWAALIGAACGVSHESEPGGSSGTDGGPDADGGGRDGCSPGEAWCQVGYDYDTCEPVQGCLDVSSDSTNCGDCGVLCGGYRRCVEGRCECIDECDGDCTDLSSDPSNCGGCGSACGPVSGCEAGICTCLGVLCGGECVDRARDPRHCGGCDQPCVDGTCVNGRCLPRGGTCDPICDVGWSCCEGGCMDVLNDALNCGGCGSFCDGGGSCSGGECFGGDCDWFCS